MISPTDLLHPSPAPHIFCVCAPQTEDMYTKFIRGFEKKSSWKYKNKTAEEN